MLKEFKQAHEIFQKNCTYFCTWPKTRPKWGQGRCAHAPGTPAPLLPPLGPVFLLCVTNSVIIHAIMCISSVYFESVTREAYFSYISTSTSLLPHTKPNTKAFSSPSPTAAFVLFLKPKSNGKPSSSPLQCLMLSIELRWRLVLYPRRS
jgi:hypothetical protein